MLEGFDVAQELNPAQSKLIWKNSLTTVDRKILTEFYNAHNSGNKIALDPACFDSKNTNALKDNQDDLQKIIQWNIKQANLEERKATTARRIEAAEADNKTFHGSAQGVEGDIAKGVKELQRNIEQPSDKVKNPIAERLKQRFRNKGEDMMA